jgi:hypothetical protein
MKTITKLTTIPDGSIIANGFGSVDYIDTYQVHKNTVKSAEEISKEIMRLPNWAIALFKVRNAIVKNFGLKVEKSEERGTFFKLIEKNDTEIVMGETDKHLDFRVSVMNNQTTHTISLTTIVHFNNAWGRVYFFPVKPFHKMIIKTMMRGYLKE